MWVLMQADIENTGIFFKQVLSAIAVMHVPVEYQDFVKAMVALQVARRNSDVIKKAKTHRCIMFGVVARRAHQGKTVVSSSISNSICKRQHAPGRQTGNVEGFVADRYVRGIQVRQAACATGPGTLDQCRIVYRCQTVRVTGRCRGELQLSEPGLGLKMGQGMRQPSRALRVPGSGIVIQKASVTGKSSFHSATSL